mmetsp:Transcript_5581/g.5741  ORF Transcript_5581/g.5741 Transcript_5581/m.5741 type:complete len:250 (+) Transcript_5581:3-752(+)
MDLFDNYPSISVDFRKLDRESLEKLLKHFNVRPPLQMTDSQLANAAAKIFQSYCVEEKDTVDKFAKDSCCSMSDVSNPQKKQRKREVSVHCLHPAVVGEQVAAKVSKSDENGSWILANVLSVDTNLEVYEVQDEDDPRRIMTIPYANLRRLTENASDVKKGDRVLAVFPETTSFYRGNVVKTPKLLNGNSNNNNNNNGNSSNNNNTNNNGQWEVVVKFDDDEDETGKPPARKVPSRFVIRSSAFEDDLF